MEFGMFGLFKDSIAAYTVRLGVDRAKAFALTLSSNIWLCHA